MTREDFVYALENEWLINCVRDEHNNIDLDATIESTDFRTGCRLHWEWLDLRTVYRIIHELGWFEDF